MLLAPSPSRSPAKYAAYGSFVRLSSPKLRLSIEYLFPNDSSIESDHIESDNDVLSELTGSTELNSELNSELNLGANSVAVKVAVADKKPSSEAEKSTS